MKKCFEDKIRDVIKLHNKSRKLEDQVKEVKAVTRPRIGFGGEEQIIVNYWTK